MDKKILIIVTNVDSYQGTEKSTGLWFGELVQFYDVFDNLGFVQDIASPMGGKCPIDPRSLKWFYNSGIEYQYKKNPEFMALLNNTTPVDEINPSEYNVIFFTGGHGTMFDFPENEKLQEITRTIFENLGIVSSVCHGYCGLLNVKLSNGRYLIDGKKLTGYSWMEEILAGVKKYVPFNVEQKANERGARYKKGFLPFIPYVQQDGRLISGQNPFSTKKLTKLIIEKLVDP